MFESIWCEVANTTDNIHLRLIVKPDEIGLFSEDLGIFFDMTKEITIGFIVDLYVKFNLTMGLTLITVEQFKKICNTAHLLRITL